ncbi:proteasome assembly chaperone 4 [Schistocerca americana]|uniref:proteasome assembly chaperone 4 n=1 Tax=Schistocerca americana TaxID=7009 RepID=UPI001F500CA4|nr:proteasome assembly chaperone 4 [Schistocerca americana]
MTSSVQTVTEVEPSVELHSFQEVLCEKLITYQVLRLQDSIFIWIGSSENPAMEDLSVAIQTQYSDKPLETRILGVGNEDNSTTLANHIARKINQPAYVSMNVPFDRLLFPAIEKRLFEEIKQCPKKFNL